MSKGLCIAIALLVTVATALVFVKGKDSQRSTIQVKGPSSQNQNKEKKLRNFDAEIVANANAFLEDGRATFRFDTFGDEVFWGNALQLHQAIKGANLGGVGPGISPSTALGLGLKVDIDALPQPLVNRLKQGRVDLNDPATTVALLKLNAVLGIQGFFQGDDLTSVGITCALCHSTVDNTLTFGVGHRLDGWANRDLDVGKIIAAAPDVSPFANLLGVDPRLNNAAKFPIAAANGFADLPHISPDEDRITKKLPSLHFYQLAIPAPAPEPGVDFNVEAAERGDELFSGKAKCNDCHVEPLWTEPGWNLHTPAEIGIDSFQADRAPDGVYKTMNLAGVFVRENGVFMNPANKGRYYHDGRFATLLDVVNHYNTRFSLGLTAQEKNDLIQYLLSLPEREEE